MAGSSSIIGRMQGVLNQPHGVPQLDKDRKIMQDQIPTPLKLLTPNADALTIGSPTEEGGDLKIYRNASGDLQVYIDADAASNTKALDIYGGVVCQNYLTVGQATLNTSYPFFINGDLGMNGSCRSTSGFVGPLLRGDNDISSLDIDIRVTSPDATSHSVCLQIDSNDILCVRATGDGAGGIIGKRSIQYGGQCHAKTDAGAADYNPSAVTSDYIISVDTTAAARAVTISTEDRDSGTAANPRVFIIKDIAGNAGANNITISLETAGTIDGAANVVINANYGSVTLMIDGTNGFVI